jgi:hypothetical protein
MVFFNSGSGTTIAEAVYVQHISIFGICEDVQQVSQRSYNVTINSHNGQLRFMPIHMLQTVVQYTGGKDNIGCQSKLLYSETALSQTPFGIGHMYMSNFLLRMIDTMTSQITDLSSWDTLYSAKNNNAYFTYRKFALWNF